MDSKGFFLGLIAAVVLFLLWRKEQGQSFTIPQIPGGTTSPQPSGGGCCGSGPSAGAAPAVQGTTWALLGMDGQITPGTPPLQASTGVGSFYGPTGPTPDTTFTNVASPVMYSTVRTAVETPVPNVPGSATTPSTEVPVRAIQPVGSYSDLGFQQRYNIAGVPRTLATRMIQ